MAVCTLCSRTYSDPRILSCLHSFCLACIKKHLVKDQAMIVCLTCNESTTILNGDLNFLPKNIRLSDLSQQESMLQKITSNSPVVCDCCEEEKSASTVYCTDCEDFLCSDCHEAHCKTKLTRNHSVHQLKELQTIDQDKKSALLLSSNSSSIKCQDHDLSFDQYCMDCSCPICCKCVVTSHKGHAMNEITEYVTSKKKDIQESVKGFPESQQSLSNTIKAGEDMKSEVNHEKSKVDQTIRQVFTTLRGLIDEREKELLKKTSDIATAKGVHLTSKLEGFQFLLQCVNKCQDLASAAVSSYTDVQFLSITDVLHKRASFLSQKVNEMSLDLCETPHIFFEESSLSKLRPMLNEFCSVSESQTDDRQVTAVVDEINSFSACDGRITPTKARNNMVCENKISTGDEFGNISPTQVDCNSEVVVVALKNDTAATRDEKHSYDKSTIILPRTSVGVGAEMKVKVVTRYCSGKEIKKGGATVSALLANSKSGKFNCSVDDRGDGTYLVSVVPQKEGRHFLSVTVNGQHVQNSPFCLHAVCQRKFAKIVEPSEKIAVNRPVSIAIFRSNLFVSSKKDHCIYVYNADYMKVQSIGSRESAELRLRSPLGIDISADGILFVANSDYDRIHKYSSDDGTFLGGYGVSGSQNGQFQCPCDVKVGPDGRIYVADRDNNRIQIFHSDWSVSRVIRSSFSSPHAIAFDLVGNFYVTDNRSDSVTVLSPDGEIIQSHNDLAHYPIGIAIDSSGNFFCRHFRPSSSAVRIFKPNGEIIHLIANLNNPHGITVTWDGHIWIADTGNNRILKY